MTSQRDLLLIQFPFSNLVESKVRPVIVMSNDYYNKISSDFIAVPITTNLQTRDYVVKINNKKLESGILHHEGRAKVDNIFHLNKALIKKNIGTINKETFKELRDILFDLINSK